MGNLSSRVKGQTERKGDSATNEKIISKIERCLKERRPFYSFEFFPPKTEPGVLNLYSRLDRMVANYEPLFIDITWGPGGSTKKLSLELSKNAQNYCATDVMMHLTCTNLSRAEIKDTLARAKDNGIRNILALRGDPPHGEDVWEPCHDGFMHAVDLVRFIRKEYGDYFGIAVAAYPEGHISSKSIDDDLKYLKQKVDAGADFVMTQMFYDVDNFLAWVPKARAAGITVPILPGIMAINNYNAFKRMVAYTKARIPQHIFRALEPIRNNDAMVKAYGIQLGIKMCQRLFKSGILGVHFYTLNLEKSVSKILGGLGLAQLRPKGSRLLPWKQSCAARRRNEDVRPIFWANRPHSYLQRTVSWDEFPNGRWGNSTSPAYGDLYDYHLMGVRPVSARQRRQMWGEALKSEQDVYDVFAEYLNGSIGRLPWCETGVMLETVPLKKLLMDINRKGFLTINSQPQVNSARSDDKVVGWGDPNGYVYQKAYVEFFTSPEGLRRVIALAQRSENKTLSYHAVNASGKQYSNYKEPHSVNAVTWGVFPGREIIQPTVVDMDSFRVWKDEAFALWTSQWQAIYPRESESHQVIQRIRDTFYLCNIVENDFVNGDLNAFMKKLVTEEVDTKSVDAPSPGATPTRGAARPPAKVREVEAQ